LILSSLFTLRTIYFIQNMASEADSSVFEHSATQDSSQTKTRGLSAHATWIHSRTARETNGEDPKLKYCIHCTVTPIYRTSVTTNMRKHLLSKHQIIVKRDLGLIQAATIQQLQQLYLRAELSGQTTDIDTQIFRKHLNQDAIDKALVSLVVVQNLPFRIVRWPEFYTFCQVLNPESSNYITTAHSQVPKKIKQSWNHYKDIVQRKLQSAISSIHLSLDVWTSPNKLLLLGIVAHFVDYQEKHWKALLALRTIANHSGKEQFAILLLVLKDYSIVQKLGAIIGDNASTNNTLCCTIEDHLLEEEDIE
jgi:hypothetical protein